MEQESIPKLLSLEEASELLCISIWTLRVWVSQGRIGSVKLGARRLLLASEVSRFVNEGIEPATQTKKPVGRPRLGVN